MKKDPILVQGTNMGDFYLLDPFSGLGSLNAAHNTWRWISRALRLVRMFFACFVTVKHLHGKARLLGFRFFGFGGSRGYVTQGWLNSLRLAKLP